MKIEERVRAALSGRLAKAYPSPDAWTSILRRVARRERLRAIRVRVVPSILALTLSAATIAVVWASFRPTPKGTRLGAANQGQSASQSPTETVCSQSESAGDFDGDGSPDAAELYALIPSPSARCGPSALDLGWHFELRVDLSSATTITVPFSDCESLFDCQLLKGSDFDGDGRDELPVMLSMSASSRTGIYRVSATGIESLYLTPPGDPGFLQPGPIRLGGEQSAIMRSGFECRIRDDGSHELLAWSAERDDAVSPYRLHVTTLELAGDTFTVVGTKDREDVTALPPDHALCP